MQITLSDFKHRIGMPRLISTGLDSVKPIINFILFNTIYADYLIRF